MYDTRPIILTRKKSEEKKTKAVSLEDEKPSFVGKAMALAIKRAREKAELSHKKLGQLMNVNAAIIADWEDQKAVYDEKVARKFEKALDIKLVPEK
jgi:ribosome-binding protein aMBF1 (putative translation factor)